MSTDHTDHTDRMEQRGLSRRDFLKLGSAGVAGAFLLGTAACGGGGGDQGGGGTGGGDGGNGLIIGLDQEPDILNGFIIGGDLAATSYATAGILESPLRLTPNITDLESAYEPMLAEEMPEVISEDPLVIEYRLREGLTFSDGEPLTSDDALFTYEQIMNEDNQIISRIGWEDVESFETPDERTVRMTFSQPYAPWRGLLSSQPGNPGILPRHVYEGEDFNTALNNEVIGSGPFVLDQWNRGENLTVTRNENYWGEAAAIERITYRFITDTNSLITSLQSGETDFINPQADVGLIERLEGFSGTEVQTAAGTVWEHIAFNLEEVDNLNLRRAVAYGVNRQQIIEEILPGQVNPLDSVIVPEQELFYTPAWEQYGHDPEQARQLVEDAVAEGAEPALRFSTTAGNNLRETLQQVVQQQLGDVGIEISIDNTSATTFFGEWTPEGNFEMGEWAWLTSPDPTMVALFSLNSLPPDGQNYYRYENEEFTELIEQADYTVSPQERAELLQEAQRIMADDVPLIPMYQRPEILAFNERLQGPQVNPSIGGAYWNIGEWTLG